MRGAGFTASELRQHLGVTAKELKEGGYTLAEIKTAGFDRHVLKTIGLV